MTQDLLSLSARTLAQRIAQRELSSETLTLACIERIAACESVIHAWQFFDPALALQQARQRDAEPIRGLLHGLPIGVKDLMDTADMPTTYGSPIYAAHRPPHDAACVAASRAAGGIVMGKTVTTEFATFQPGPTRNPRAPANRPHTPGGSSSGSAAAVAAGMAPLAFATQTAGSIIRPAAYCGVVGYKPSHGTLPLSGVKPLAPSLDTIGVLARSVDDAAFFIAALQKKTWTPGPPGRLRVGLCRTPHWARASADTDAILLHAVHLLEQAGASVSEINLPTPCSGLTEAQIDIMAYEAAAAFQPEMTHHASALSASFSTLLNYGGALGERRYLAAQDLARQARHSIDALFEQVDIVLAPSAEGEAPAGLEATGDPIFNRLWTLLGNPCVHVPLGSGRNAMPLGVTLVGPRHGDAATLTLAHLLEQRAAWR